MTIVKTKITKILLKVRNLVELSLIDTSQITFNKLLLVWNQYVIFIKTHLKARKHCETTFHEIHFEDLFMNYEILL